MVVSAHIISKIIQKNLKLDGSIENCRLCIKTAKHKFDVMFTYFFFNLFNFEVTSGFLSEWTQYFSFFTLCLKLIVDRNRI